MSYSKFFQGVAIGMTAFTLLWENYFCLKQKDDRNNIEDSWNNVGKYLSKAIKDYEKNTIQKI